jgi:multimeric flavodoxin WrbA
MMVAAFLGSPRAGGNTDTLAAEMLEGARAAGCETESHALRRLDVRPCTGCERCWEKDRPCVLSDDTARLYEAIARADALLFATPVYWYGPTAIMKAFIDRLVVYNRPRGRPLIDGKTAVLVSAWEEQGPEAAEALVRLFELSFRYLGLRFADRLLVDGCGPKGAALQKPFALARAREIGLGLPAALRREPR